MSHRRNWYRGAIALSQTRETQSTHGFLALMDSHANATVKDPEVSQHQMNLSHSIDKDGRVIPHLIKKFFNVSPKGLKRSATTA